MVALASAWGAEEGMESVIAHPLWMLVPWAVFAVAAGLKFWRLTSGFRSSRQGSARQSERFRQSLERIWQNDQQGQ